MPKKPSELTLLSKESRIDSQTLRQAAKRGGRIEDFRGWREGEHYIRCPECGIGFAELTLHLKRKHKWGSAQFSTYEGLVMAPLTSSLRAKTEAQKQHQSQVLKARFQTEAGEITRQQIRDAAKRHMDNGYKEKASQFLRHLNNTPEARARISQTMLKEWRTGNRRIAVQNYVENNRQAVITSAAHARLFLRSTSKLHERVKSILACISDLPFESEYPLGVFLVDECLPQHKVVLEVMGCYWHSCTLCGQHGPKKNRSRDAFKQDYLRKEGYTCLYIWEHECKTDEDIKARLLTLLGEVNCG